ncbi:MAG: hypothetical protein OEY23_25780 [Acidimicrobiia bacterium]|nr:hypothetical protein [Acidimicrobiia bacterium]
MTALYGRRTITAGEQTTPPDGAPRVSAPAAPASPAQAVTAPNVTPPSVGSLVAWLYDGRAQVGIVVGLNVTRQTAWVHVAGQRSGARPVPRPLDDLVVLATPDEMVSVAASRLGVSP